MRVKRKGVQIDKKRIGSVGILVIVTCFLVCYHWTNEAIKTAHIMPVAPKADIGNLVRQSELGKEELHIISEQTGLREKTIQSLLEQGQAQRLLKLQEVYYTEVGMESIRTTPLTICEYVIDEKGNRTRGMEIVDIQDGDILITKNSRFLGWRNGHVGLVADAKKGLVLEAVMLGTNTTFCQIKEWEKYPSFQVLRLKEEFRNTDNIEKVVTYAKQNLVDIPYRLEAGVWDRIKGSLWKENADLQEGQITQTIEATLSGTHCAHLVWYAYKQVGIDLDSDGGFFVTPYDIQNSPYLEVVQSYGY